jgi:hypothetical protein
MNTATTSENQSGAVIEIDSLETVRLLIVQSGEKLQAAADMLHRLYMSDKTIVEQLTSGPDALPEGFVNGLLRVAERSLHPKLLFNRCPAYRKISLMAYSSQSEILDKGAVEVVVNPDSGDFIKIDLVKLEGPQLDQAMSHAGVRSRDEQRAWLRRKQSSLTPVERAVGPAYQIRKDKLVMFRACELSKVEILRLLEQMVA